MDLGAAARVCFCRPRSNNKRDVRVQQHNCVALQLGGPIPLVSSAIPPGWHAPGVRTSRELMQVSCGPAFSRYASTRHRTSMSRPCSTHHGLTNCPPLGRYANATRSPIRSWRDARTASWAKAAHGQRNSNGATRVQTRIPRMDWGLSRTSSPFPLTHGDHGKAHAGRRVRVGAMVVHSR